MPTDPRDYKLEIRSLEADDVPEAPVAGKSDRKYISVFYACCQVYNRVYASRDGGHYDARCPKCGRWMRFVVGPGGIERRSFVVE